MRGHRLAALAGIAVLAATWSGCAATGRAYVWNDSPVPVNVFWRTGNMLWGHTLQPGESVSAVTDASCELRDVYWATPDNPLPRGETARLCPGQVWTIRADGESIGPVPDSWATSPPPRVNTARPR